MGVELAAFLGVAALLTITPGVDMALVTRTALAEGLPAALRTSAGICSGLLVWAAASAVGVAALLAASATAFTVLKVAGAGYLVYLGVQALRGASRATDDAPAPLPGPAFRRGLFSNLLNPKIAVFYPTIVPQFVDSDGALLLPFLLLAGVHVAISIVWLAGFAWAVARAGDLFRRRRVRRVIETVTGGVLLGLGARLALTSR